MTFTEIADSVLDAIGRTPVVRLKRLAPVGGANVFVKLEYFNPTGSYKDRMALAMICAVKGYAFVPLSSDAFAREKIQTMQAFGADVQIVPSEGGKVTPGLFDRFRERIAVLQNEPETFWTDQFHNTDALNGYREIGVELLNQIGAVDLFCGAVGTAGMLVGVSRALKASGSRARIVALEPASSPVLTTGRSGAHRVEGTAPGFVPPHLTPSDYDEARAIDEEEARAMARRLAKEEGIFAGISTGLNVVAAIQCAAELGSGHNIATVAVDTGLKYLNGDLFADGAAS